MSRAEPSAAGSWGWANLGRRVSKPGAGWQWGVEGAPGAVRWGVASLMKICKEFVFLMTAAGPGEGVGAK